MYAAGFEIGHSVSAALVVDAHDVRAGHAFKKIAGDVQRRRLGGSIVELTRLRIRKLQPPRNRLHGERLADDEHIGYRYVKRYGNQIAQLIEGSVLVDHC